MELQHIWAVALRHLRLWKNEMNLILVALYWPMFDLVLWGFLGTWIQKTQAASNYKAAFVLGILLWQICCRTTMSVLVSFIEELWSQNLVILFSLPLRISEWIAGITLFAFILVGCIITYCMGLIMLIYGLSLYQILHAIAFFGPALFISGIWLGFMALFAIVCIGKRAQEVGWILGWFFAPFIGAFYPIETLPAWGQSLSRYLPMTHIFEGLRASLLHNESPIPYLMIGYALAITYATICIAIFCILFKWTKKRGLTRLMD